MTFDLHIHGETPAELLAALQQLNTSPLQPPQSEPVPQPEKSKAQPGKAEAQRTEARSRPCGGAAGKPYDDRHAVGPCRPCGHFQCSYLCAVRFGQRSICTHRNPCYHYFI